MSDLLSRAIQIKNETQVGANSANRLGGLFEDIINKIEITGVTYDELVALINSSSLKAGSYYRITDFQTVHYLSDGMGLIEDSSGNKVIHVGDNEPLIVLAITNNELSNQAYSEQYPQDIIHYNWDPDYWKEDYSFGGDNYVIIPGFKGAITFRKDTKNNISVGYDWRNVVMRLWKWDFPEYDPAVNYGKSSQKAESYTGKPANDLTNTVKSSGGIYISLKDNNLGNDLTDTTYWLRVASFYYTEYLCSQSSKAEDINDYKDYKLFEPMNEYPIGVWNLEIKPYSEKYDSWYYSATIIYPNVFLLDANSYGPYNVLGVKLDFGCGHNIFYGSQLSNHFRIFSVNNIFSDSNDNFIGISACMSDYGFEKNTGIFTYCAFGKNFKSNEAKGHLTCVIIGNSVSNNIFSGMLTGFDKQSLIRIPDGFKNNSFKVNFQTKFTTSPTEYDFTGATHVFAEYPCDLIKTPNGTKILTYVDDSGNLISGDPLN